MTERVHIPASPACGQWETLLADALDGLLRPEDEATFAAHMASCPACSAMFDEARRGREWLEFLSPEPEVPAGLFEKILAQTGPGKTLEPRLAGNAGAVLPMPPAWQKPGFMAKIRRFAEPRLMMTAAMAFFSIALTLNLTGVRLSSVKLSDLRPAAVRSYMERRITMASTPIVRYYDHLRLVYEVQTRMREFQRSTEGNDQGGGDKQNNSAPSSPGESHRNQGGKDGGSRSDPPQESISPNLKDFDLLETSLTLPTGHAHSGGSALILRERSTSWTA
jgi:hypothetical protein